MKTDKIDNSFSPESIDVAISNIRKYQTQTPISHLIINDNEIVLKLENKIFPTRSFKLRGMINALAKYITSLSHERLPELITASTGNQGISLAFAASLLNIKTRCLVPEYSGTVSKSQKDRLWDKYFTEAPQRLRQSVEQSRIVKRA